MTKGADVALITRTTAVWTGAPGLPGYSQFYRETTGDIPADAQGAHNRVATFFAGLAALIPDAVTVTVDPLYAVLEETTGVIGMEDTVETPAAGTVGTYVSGWNSQVGALVEWTTGEFYNGRRLRGRTYLVPLGNVSDSDGTMPGGTLTVIQAAAAYIGSASTGFLVWRRPVNGIGGHGSSITGLIVRDKAAILRSRML